MRWSASPEVTSGGPGRTRPTAATKPWQRRFLWPNVLIEQRPGALSVLQVQPAGAGRSRVQQFECTAQGDDPKASAGDDRMRRVLGEQLERELAIAASTQQGAGDPDYVPDASVPPSPAAAAFRRMLLAAEA